MAPPDCSQHFPGLGTEVAVGVVVGAPGDDADVFDDGAMAMAPPFEDVGVGSLQVCNGQVYVGSRNEASGTQLQEPTPRPPAEYPTIDQHRPRLYPIGDEIGQRKAKINPNVSNFDQFRPRLVGSERIGDELRIRPNLAGIDRIWGDFGQCRPNAGQFRLNSAICCTESHEFGPIWSLPDSVRNRPNGSTWVDFDVCSMRPRGRSNVAWCVAMRSNIVHAVYAAAG